jgi:GNAT-family acetyltransferase (TIGR03103 family)
MDSEVALAMGWGRLIFGHTFQTNEQLADTLLAERDGERDISLYIRDPHVLLSLAPSELFLDPSHTYRLWSYKYKAASEINKRVNIRRLETEADAAEANRIWATRHMVESDPEFMLDVHASKLRTYLVAETPEADGLIGVVVGVDHVEAFNDPENGSSLWCLAVDPKTSIPGVGEALVRHLVEHYFARGRDYVDLSVMHDNVFAIKLYEKLGYQRVPVFCVKRKNPINENLFIAPPPDANLNPYARIITDEARRRGIAVEVLDEEFGYFQLTLGGRSVACRESLTELTSAVAFCRCDDKRLTHRVLAKAGVCVPDQQLAGIPAADKEFLEKHDRVVVKPARGEQGAGVFVDISDPAELDRAIDAASQHCSDVIIESYVEGEDVRIIVIGSEVVAAAVRKPACIAGTGEHTVEELLEKYNRRRMAATGGESHVPLDAETERCIRLAGYEMDSVLPAGETLTARKTANLHTGGTIHDITPRLHPELRAAAVNAAGAIGVPVTGLDLAVPDLEGPDYAVIEANERPGLANHEPQPTAERFIDLLFPETAVTTEDEIANQESA